MRWRIALASAVAAGALAGAAEAQELSDRSPSVARYDSRLSAPASIDKHDRALARQGVEIRLSTRFAMEQEIVRGLIRVAPHPDNRFLRVEIDSPDFFRGSDVTLEGELAARNHFFSWKSLPPGSYELVVTVLGSEGVRTRRQVTFAVIGTSAAFGR
jgi:hypothetical protein